MSKTEASSGVNQEEYSTEDAAYLQTVVFGLGQQKSSYTLHLLNPLSPYRGVAG